MIPNRTLKRYFLIRDLFKFVPAPDAKLDDSKGRRFVYVTDQQAVAFPIGLAFGICREHRWLALEQSLFFKDFVAAFAPVFHARRP